MNGHSLSVGAAPMCNTENSPQTEHTWHYEGAEKLLEVWWKPVNKPEVDLRNIKREKLVKLLDKIKCEIVSETQTEDQLAYVLSESSMFLSERRFILKTCGKTTLLFAMEDILKLAREIGFKDVEDIFYSRKNFLRPELQVGPHKNFEDEVSVLDKIFPNGAAYVLGRMNGDCWYLYTLDVALSVQEPDQTLEILMSDLDRDVMAQFYKTDCTTAEEVSEKTGISDLLPELKIDAVLFDPCGYSMNGLLPNGGYVTIHVTPEPEFSYVSFESNVSRKNYTELVEKILDIFRPNKFVMTLFANQTALCGSSYDTFKQSTFPGYKIQDRQYSQFKNYDLTFGHFCRTGLS
ncbi:S-adenosylmethionine decarboxylase proenzyme-like isoform X2 [Ptychodera flava]|uniref:S-adenosylmethionine decarboxylase proenzyme-like isoform X2 n=1 Tax=Ptychodera flava TaxID=63121 RepID=UPI00396A33CB